jgi:hypothetical protein
MKRNAHELAMNIGADLFRNTMAYTQHDQDINGHGNGDAIHAFEGISDDNDSDYDKNNDEINRKNQEYIQGDIEEGGLKVRNQHSIVDYMDSYRTLSTAVKKLRKKVDTNSLSPKDKNLSGSGGLGRSPKSTQSNSSPNFRKQMSRLEKSASQNRNIRQNDLDLGDISDVEEVNSMPFTIDTRRSPSSLSGSRMNRVIQDMKSNTKPSNNTSNTSTSIGGIEVDNKIVEAIAINFQTHLFDSSDEDD